MTEHDETTCTDENCPSWDTDHDEYVHWSPGLGKWTWGEEACPDCSDL